MADLARHEAMDIRDERSRSIAFAKLLIEDVMEARARLNEKDSQTARRDVVRSSLAAMEGMTWLAREHVRATLSDLGELSPIADMALREQSYSVSAGGKLDIQSRSLPLPSAIRFVVAQAKIISPDISIDFSVVGWASLRKSITIRNRITHPRPESDLNVSNDDLTRVQSGLSWLLATVNYIMASTNLALVSFSKQLKDVVRRLSAGDAEAIADYQAALRQLDDKTD